MLLWLQSTLSSSVLVKMIGSKHFHQLWDRLHNGFFPRTNVKARQLQIELRTTKLFRKFVYDYLQNIKSIFDSLSVIGDPVSHKEQVDDILEGLLREFESLVNLVSINNRFPSLSIDKLEALLHS